MRAGRTYARTPMGCGWSLLWGRLRGETVTGMDVASRTGPPALEASEQLPAGKMTARRGDRWGRVKIHAPLTSSSRIVPARLSVPRVGIDRRALDMPERR